MNEKRKSKYIFIYVIPYIHSPVMGLFLNMSMVTMITFPGRSLIIKKINWVEEARKFSFSAMLSPNIPGLATLLNKTFPFLTAE